MNARSNKTATFGRTLAAAALCATFALPAIAGPKAMTWTTRGVDPSSAEAWTIVGADNSTNAYTGDMIRSAKLRILCFVPGNAPVPSNYTSPANDFYRAWSGGKVGLTKKYKASNIPNRAAANAICQARFGGNAKVAEHHDNGVGGWRLGARIHSQTMVKYRLKKQAQVGAIRFWASINDQQANPWGNGAW